MSLDVRSYDLYYTPPLQQAPKTTASIAAAAAAAAASSSSFILPQQEFVHLRVPGVAERRPALSLGDRVELRLADRSAAQHSLAIYAYVHSVREETVSLTFPLAQIIECLRHELDEKIMQQRQKDGPLEEEDDESSLITATERKDKFFSSCLFHVRFGFDRISFRFMYRALWLLHASPHSTERLLFPSSRHAQAQAHAQDPLLLRDLPTIEPIDPKLNFEQLTAVQLIVAKSHGQAPFVIFGPPGQLFSHAGRSAGLLRSRRLLLPCCFFVCRHGQNSDGRRNGVAASAFLPKFLRDSRSCVGRRPFECRRRRDRGAFGSALDSS
jgi:hypothetical protein